MVQKISERLYFVYNSGSKQSKQSNKLNFKLSLLGALLGIFLLPNLAYLSDITPEKIIELTNRQRQSAGLSGLTASRLLTQAAEDKSRAILNSQIFNHTINDKKFSSWIRAAGYGYSYAGENLAIDFDASEDVINAWEKSPPHKKNLLSPYYREIGAAVLSGKFQGQETTVVVQIFGAPAAASAGRLAPGEEFLNLNFSEINFAGNQIFRYEAPIGAANKFILPRLNNYAGQANFDKELAALAASGDSRQSKLFIFSNRANKFFVQPKIDFAPDNFLLISFALIYWLIYPRSYYLLKKSRPKGA